MALIMVKHHGQRHARVSPLALLFKDRGQRRAGPGSHGIVVKDHGQHHRQSSPPRPLPCLAPEDGVFDLNRVVSTQHQGPSCSSELAHEELLLRSLSVEGLSAFWCWSVCHTRGQAQTRGVLN